MRRARTSSSLPLSTLVIYFVLFMMTSRHKGSASGELGLKPFTIVTGEPRKLDCYLRDGSLRLYWARTKNDLIDHLVRTDDAFVATIPLSTYADYSHTPSDFHLVNCRDQSCPCSNYVMCWECECTKVAVPKEGVTIKCKGYTETLSGEDPEACTCESPDFRGNDKARLCQNAIENQMDSDYCFKIVELAVQDPIEDVQKEGTATKRSKD